MNSVKFQDTKLVYRNLLHFYTLRINYQKEKWRKQLHVPSIKKNKYLRINLIKKVKDLYWKTPRHRWKKLKMKVKVLVTQSCPTLCDPMDRNPLGSYVHGILQARILEWVAIPFSRGLPIRGIKPKSPALHMDSLPPELWGQKRWQGILCPWIIRINIIKMILTMYRLDAIPIEIPVVFFIGVEKILKCVRKHKRSQTDKAILRKTLELEVSCLLHIILQSYTHQYSMVLAQKQIHRSVDQNREPGTNPWISCLLPITKVGRIQNREKSLQ